MGVGEAPGLSGAAASGATTGGEGQFVDDKPHGEGLMYPAQEEGPEGSEAEEGVETETAVPRAVRVRARGATYCWFG